MHGWMAQAFLSMFFAGFTSVIAKKGMDGLSAELGLTVRTGFVCLYVLIFGWLTVPAAQLGNLQRHHAGWLALSALTTAASWVFYYRAIAVGEVATVTLIDKGSVVVAMALAWLILKEEITPRMVLGAGLIVAGLLVIARK